MTAAARTLLALVDRFVGAPVAMITRLSDEADDVWEPFLRDAGLVPTARSPLAIEA